MFLFSEDHHVLFWRLSVIDSQRKKCRKDGCPWRVNEWKDGEEELDGWMNGWMDGWMDG